MLPNTNTLTTNIFNAFPQYNMRRYSGSCEKTLSTTTVSDVIKDEVSLQTASKKKKTKTKILFGSTIASTILTAGIAGLFLFKGVHGSAFKNRISLYGQKLQDDIQAMGQNSAKDIPSKVVYHTKKGMKKLLDLMQASSNFTTFKDYGSSKVLTKTKPTKAFADKSTKMFKKVVDNTLGRQYDVVEVDISKLTSRLQQNDLAELRKLDTSQLVEIKGKSQTLGKWLDEIEEQTGIIGKTFTETFTEGARLNRDTKRMSDLRTLPAKIHERFFKDGKKSLLDLKNYQTYATEDLSKDIQAKYANEIVSAQKKITNNIGAITSKIKSNVTSFSDDINPSDEASKKLVSTLKELVEKFKNCSGENEIADRNKISKEISSILGELTDSVGKNTIYSCEEQTKFSKLISEILKDVSSCETDESKGALEKIMTILKGLNSVQVEGSTDTIVSKDSYKNFEKMSKRIATDLESATKLEKGEYFLKQAELVVGSAPTDVISLLFPIGAGAYAVAKGKDKDERVSATLTTCVPLVGTFATFIYGTVKMLSGAKNLIFSGVSGAMLGMLGDYCDSLYKKSKNPNEVKYAVKDGYDKIWTGLESQIHKFDEKEENEIKK